MNRELMADDRTTAPDRLLLLRDGETGIDGYPKDWKLTASGAAKIITAFNRKGLDLPIDYHHHTLNGDAKDQGIAAGWVTGLEYIEGDGLYATGVTWTKAAKAQVESEQFRYFSPVVLYNEKTEEFFELHSVALTNKPATMNQEKLMAASQEALRQFGAETRPNKGDDDMPTLKTATKKRGAAKGETTRKRRKVTAQETMDVDMEALPEEQAADMEDLDSALVSLKEELMAQGSELSDDASGIEIVNAAIAMVASAAAEEHPDDEEEDEVNAEEKTKTVAAEQARVKGLEVKAGQHDLLVAEVKELTDERNANRVKMLIAEQVEANKINPEDEDAMKSARELATLDADVFKSTYASIQPYAAPGSVVRATAGKSSSPGGNKRKRIIVQAAHDWQNDPLPKQMAVASDSAFVQQRKWLTGRLRDAGMGEVTDKELEAVIAGE